MAWLIIWSYLICILIFSYSEVVKANSQMPKIFVDVEPVQVIDPLQKGFQIVLREDFIEHYLDPGRMPTLFLSAIPLGPDTQAKRIMYLREDLNGNLLILNGLEKKTWYFVCVEFENVIRKENRGNMTTKCELIRTLDDFGKKGNSVISDVRIREVGDSFLTFELAVESQGELQLLAYLDSGSSPVQTFILKRPHSLRIHFRDLSPGFNYDRLCVIYKPLLETYTMMGRAVHVTKTECHFGGLETKARSPHDRYMSDGGAGGTQSLKAQSLELKERRSTDRRSSSGHSLVGSKSTFWNLFGGLLVCIFLYAKMVTVEGTS